MITTRFIKITEYPKYRDWLNSLDQDSRDLYFGGYADDSHIDLLVEQVVANPLMHYFLVAEDAYENWLGVMHVVKLDANSVEIGVSVSQHHRRKGIGNRLMQESIVWCCNRFVDNVYLHCFSGNHYAHMLCENNGLSIVPENGEACVSLPPPSIITTDDEVARMHIIVYNIVMNHVLNAVSGLNKQK